MSSNLKNAVVALCRALQGIPSVSCDAVRRTLAPNGYKTTFGTRWPTAALRGRRKHTEARRKKSYKRTPIYADFRQALPHCRLRE